MKKLIWLICLTVVLGLFAGCQTAPEGTQTSISTDGTEPANTGTTVPLNTEPVDIRPLPPENPGSSLIEYDPDRQIYIASENVYMDYYPGTTMLPSFYFNIFSRQPLDTEKISVTFPVDLPFVVVVNSKDEVVRKTEAMLYTDADSCLPYYVYQAYRGVTPSMGTSGDVYADFAALTELDLPEFYVCSVVVALVNLNDLQETVELNEVDVTIDGETYEAKLGRVRLFPQGTSPTNVPVVKRQGAAGNFCQPYNDGICWLSNVFPLEEVTEDITLTGLYLLEEESQVLDIIVNMTSGGQSMQIKWDGNSPIYLYKGDSVSIDVIIKNELTEKLLNYVMLHTVVEFTNSENEQVCTVSTKVGSLGRNLHEYYAIIFDGVDMEPYYRDYYYQLNEQSWRLAYH